VKGTTHTQWGCSNGACVLVGCDVGFADCDGNPANGCEADLKSPASCESCGTACGPNQICTPTGCSSACPAPLTYCNGSCVDLSTTIDHCGACTTSCADPVHGVAVCSGGTCGASCNPGYTAVNGKCFDIANDPNCCGPTCTQCQTPPDGGDIGCSAGTCVPLCESGMMLCSGVCVEPHGDLANCGGCGATCSGLCVGGVCDTTAKEVIATTTPFQTVMMVADGTSVFWIEGGANIMQVDRTGASAPIALATGQQGASYLAFDSTSVYWTNTSGGGVFMATKGTPGATFVANATGPWFVAVNSGYVYYDSDNRGTLYRVPKGMSGTPQTVWTAPNQGFGPQPLASLAVDDSYLWGSADGSGGLFRASLDGTNLTYLYHHPSNGGGVGVVFGPGIVLLSAEGLFTLGEASLSPAGPWLVTAQFINQGSAFGVAADATYAYAVIGGNAYDYGKINTPGIFRVAICGGPAEHLTPIGMSASDGIAAADDLWIYWADFTGAIHRRHK
jgi:hypothetical protein